MVLRSTIRAAPEQPPDVLPPDVLPSTQPAEADTNVADSGPIGADVCGAQPAVPGSSATPGTGLMTGTRAPPPAVAPAAVAVMQMTAIIVPVLRSSSDQADRAHVMTFRRTPAVFGWGRLGRGENDWSARLPGRYTRGMAAMIRLLLAPPR
jgi:hypothetical protein